MGQIDLLGEITARAKERMSGLSQPNQEDGGDLAYFKGNGCPELIYMHSDIKTLERTGIIRDLRQVSLTFWLGLIYYARN